MDDAPPCRGTVTAVRAGRRAFRAGVLAVLAATATGMGTGAAAPAAPSARAAATAPARAWPTAPPVHGSFPPPPASGNPTWSGEVAWATKNGVAAYDHVVGAWVQPAVAASASSGYADTWVGVDGYDGKLLQAGTMAATGGGTTWYEAWFVAWNGTTSGMTVIHEPVAPGDHLEVVLDRVAPGQWSTKVEDSTARWAWSTTVTYAATGSTAEWIEEDPGTWSTRSRYQTLADYGSVTFTTMVAGGTPPRVVTALDIVDNGSILSYPGTYVASQASVSVRYGQPAPTLRAVSPSSGPPSGGTLVDLTGADLGPNATVKFGGVEAAVVRSSTSSIVVRTPAHVPGKVPVTVTVGGSGAVEDAAASPQAAFDYAADPGYVVALASGALAPFGSAHGAAVAQSGVGGVVGVARDVATGGYWEATSGGGVYDVGAPDLGTLEAFVQRLGLGSVTGITATPTGSGYWLVTATGGVYDFGAARSFGTLHHARLAAKVVGITATPTGRGYWLVAADGGVFAFGAARFLGSAGALRLHAAVVGITATPTGRGYWLVAADGGVFTYGTAGYFGSAAGAHLGSPVVGLAASPTGRGYWIAAEDGRVLAFGAAPFYGSAARSVRVPPSVAIVAG